MKITSSWPDVLWEPDMQNLSSYLVPPWGPGHWSTHLWWPYLRGLRRALAEHENGHWWFFGGWWSECSRNRMILILVHWTNSTALWESEKGLNIAHLKIWQKMIHLDKLCCDWGGGLSQHRQMSGCQVAILAIPIHTYWWLTSRVKDLVSQMNNRCVQGLAPFNGNKAAWGVQAC